MIDSEFFFNEDGLNFTNMKVSILFWVLKFVSLSLFWKYSVCSVSSLSREWPLPTHLSIKYGFFLCNEKTYVFIIIFLSKMILFLSWPTNEKHGSNILDVFQINIFTFIKIASLEQRELFITHRVLSCDQTRSDWFEEMFYMIFRWHCVSGNWVKNSQSYSVQGVSTVWTHRPLSGPWVALC